MKTAGFTGTRRGMTSEQRLEVSKLLDRENVKRGVHGDCIGADCDFHLLAMQKGLFVVVRPCTLVGQRSFCQGAGYTYLAKPPLERNRDIVQQADVVIACPGEEKEVTRSGTWSTIRYAKRMGKKLYIVYPSGKVVTY